MTGVQAVRNLSTFGSAELKERATRLRPRPHYAGVTADLVSLRGFGPPRPNLLADLVPLKFGTPFKMSILSRYFLIFQL